MNPLHPPSRGRRWGAEPSLPAARRPPAAEPTPAGEEESSAATASSPEDSLTIYVARAPRPAPAQAVPIGGEACCLLPWSSFAAFVVARNNKREEPVAHIHSELLRGL